LEKREIANGVFIRIENCGSSFLVGALARAAVSRRLYLNLFASGGAL
jgi:hypothetical protein